MSALLTTAAYSFFFAVWGCDQTCLYLGSITRFSTEIYDFFAELMVEPINAITKLLVAA